MKYTVKQLADLAGVSIRTLHYYDEIGLLVPACYGENGYRYYDEPALFRLQQILFYKELDFGLEEIKEILDRPDFDLVHALQAHRVSLEQKVERLHRLIRTVDSTILYLRGEIDMESEQLFEEFSEEKQKQYEKELRDRLGDKAFEGVIDWNSYTPEQKVKIKAEGGANYRDLLAHMSKGYDSPEVQQIIARWHQHLRYFYEPTTERLLGLAQMYTEHPDFVALYKKMHPDMPQFLRQAIEYYCKDR